MCTCLSLSYRRLERPRNRKWTHPRFTVSLKFRGLHNPPMNASLLHIFERRQTSLSTNREAGVIIFSSEQSLGFIRIEILHASSAGSQMQSCQCASGSIRTCTRTWRHLRAAGAPCGRAASTGVPQAGSLGHPAAEWHRSRKAPCAPAPAPGPPAAAWSPLLGMWPWYLRESMTTLALMEPNAHQGFTRCGAPSLI